MKKIKNITNIYNKEGKSIEETLENLIFSYLESNNDN